MAQTQNEKEALLCTFGDCMELQNGEGEFCDVHGQFYKCYECGQVRHLSPFETGYGETRMLCDNCYPTVK